ncbi:MAG: ABC transporter ATP-binding protein [Gammaproteobacteria bacterium]|nr:ABC transporter ATP-binding protein [Gammaproteobacteria bacterium]MCF6230653.1 ABC transporter ATP-binding protein [Gammaproteobacteria bacterium]
MIEVKNLVFEYPGTLALDNVSLSISEGEIAALVGPNGAGKTTLMRAISGLDTPISGSVRVDGLDVLQYPRQAHQRMGYLADFFGLYDELTLRQALHYAALSHGIGSESLEASIVLAAQRLQLEGRLSQPVKALSRGLSQRLAIAQAIIHQPKVLLLDEPAAGLDPQARKALSDLFLALRDQGMTLLVSSHILAELEEYCSVMVVVEQGRIIDQQSLSTLHAQHEVLRIACATPSPTLPSMLQNYSGVELMSDDQQDCLIQISTDPAVQYQLLQQLLSQGFSVYHFAPAQRNMQESYLQTVKQYQESK